MEEIKLHKRVKIELTSAYKLQMAESYIKKLNQTIGSDQSYIEELEDKVKHLETSQEQLQKQIDILQNNYKKIKDKYSQDMQKILSIDDFYLKQKSEIDRLTLEVEKLRMIRDQLIYQLNY